MKKKKKVIQTRYLQRSCTSVFVVLLHFCRLEGNCSGSSYLCSGCRVVPLDENARSAEFTEGEWVIRKKKIQSYISCHFCVSFFYHFRAVTHFWRSLHSCHSFFFYYPFHRCRDVICNFFNLLIFLISPILLISTSCLSCVTFTISLSSPILIFFFFCPFPYMYPLLLVFLPKSSFASPILIGSQMRFLCILVVWHTILRPILADNEGLISIPSSSRAGRLIGLWIDIFTPTLSVKRSGK